MGSLHSLPQGNCRPFRVGLGLGWVIGKARPRNLTNSVGAELHRSALGLVSLARPLALHPPGPHSATQSVYFRAPLRNRGEEFRSSLPTRPKSLICRFRNTASHIVFNITHSF